MSEVSMSVKDYLKAILDALMKGELDVLNTTNIQIVSEITLQLLQKNQWTDDDITNATTIILISQIVYNNTDKSILFLDDGVYDLLLEKYKPYNPQFQVGAPDIRFDQDGEIVKNQVIEPLIMLDDDAKKILDNGLFLEDLDKQAPIDLCLFKEIDRTSTKRINKKTTNVPHMYPKLVGSLDKCKFTLNKEAIERDVFDDPTVKIFERDFLAKHLQMGLIDMTTPFEMVCELKYDGMSVEADVTDHIISARTRGDANNDIAADLTDILGGYEFPYAKDVPDNEAFGMKFEAIITYQNMSKYSMLRQKNYKNCRNTIVGLIGSADAYNYRDLITLVPLSTSVEDVDRVDEINFLNKYYSSGEYLRYSVIQGNYNEILYQVYRFVKEAEAIRPIMPFMYDGVVISYRDPRIIQALGRENSINKYSMAIKFNPLCRQAIFTGYSFTVGQDGTITPIIHYTPVEFYGTIHDKSSGHSYNRFKELNLAPGDILDIEYMNDVMPYVSKPILDSNIKNPNPPIPFPTNCPFCGSQIEIAPSGKSAICPNKRCPERLINMMANMMDKLNLKDFGEETFRFLGTTSFHQLINYTIDDVKALGPVTSTKLIERIQEIKTAPTYDYKLMGALGFTGMAAETWRKILNQIPLMEIMAMDDADLYNALVSIKSIGAKTASNIIEERKYFQDDIDDILTDCNVISTFGMESGKNIRFTGCRPSEELYDYLTKLGHDARPDAGVTKATDILVVPYIGFSSAKTNKVRPDATIVDMATFVADPGRWL